MDDVEFGNVIVVPASAPSYSSTSDSYSYLYTALKLNLCVV